MTGPAPILQWVGGKARLLPELSPKLIGGNRFYDGFLGGGAVTCAMWEHYKDKGMFAGDRSEPLLILYEVLREGCAKEVYAKAQAIVERHRDVGYSTEFYNRIRAAFNTGVRYLGPDIRDGCLGELVISHNSITLAAQMLYLNRACFNGLWRTNKSGGMNSPLGDGRGRKRLPPREMLSALGDALVSVDVDHRDWLDTVDSASSGDVVYLDPPFASEDGRDFTDYSDKWSWGDTLALVREADALTARDVRVVTSQSVEGSYAFDDTWEREYVYLGSGISRSKDKGRAEVILWKGPMP